jgi:hypothetical protein
VNRGYDAKTLSADGKLTTHRHLRRAHLSRRRVSSRVSRQRLRAGALREFGEALHHERDRRPREGHEHREGSEFLTSTDERFRPVNACNGPDGALYLVDMYRGIIQHQSFLTHYLIANIQARKLEQPFNMGRIWRIVPEGSARSP